jgi:F-type H+-transporting ATPase subunit b
MPVNGWTIALQVINFLILAWILNRVLYKPVARMIAGRQQQIEDAFSRAAGKEQDADDARRRYQALIEDIDTERQRVLADAKIGAEAEHRRLVELAHAQGDAIKAAMRHESEKERDAIADAASTWAIDAAVTLSTHLLTDLSPSTPAEMFLEHIVKKLRDLPEERRADLLAGVSEGAEVIVVTAQPLDAAEQQRWRTRLADTLEVPTQINFTADPSLIAGVEVRFPRADVAHCWRDAVAEARRRMLDHARPY